MQPNDILLTILAGWAFVVLLFAVLAWRRVRRIRGASVLIGEAMQTQGISPADAESAGVQDETLAAARRCAACTAQAECRSSLAKFIPHGLPSQCPNRAFFDYVKWRKGTRSRQSMPVSAISTPPWAFVAERLRDQESHR